MMIKSEDFTPYVYKNSRDYKALLTLLDVILNISKYEIDNIQDFYDPMKCPMELLPYLAELVGYEYNYKDSVRENRIIIANFAKMIHYRGSETGIKLAAVLSLNSAGNLEEIEDLQFLEVTYDRENAIINVIYPRNNTKVRNLMDYVRPVGMSANLIGAAGFTAHEQVGITTEVDVLVRPFEKGRDSVDYAVGIAEVSLGSLSRRRTGSSKFGKTWQELLENENTWNDLLEGEITWESFLED